MAQLSDDCFAFGGELMKAAEAIRILAERVAPVATPESVPLAAARGRTLAEDLVAHRDVDRAGHGLQPWRSCLEGRRRAEINQVGIDSLARI